LKLVSGALLLLSMLGCARGCPSSRPPIHPNPNMDNQEKYRAQAASDFFYDGKTMRTPVEGTVARDGLTLVENNRLAVAPDAHLGDVPFHTGKDDAGEFLTAIPVAADASLVERGEERYMIYCRPCHDKKGNGKGILTERGGVPVPSFHEDRLVALKVGEIFETVTLGKGLMPGYGYPIPAGDRWAIISYVRTLQQGGQAGAIASAGSSGVDR
jgi:mono/diheme cytochrome c family protein